MVTWLVAFTKPRSEVLAQEHLERQGFEVLCPLMRVQKKHRLKWTWIEEPLFPRYVFVGAKPEQSWAPVRSTVGVASLVKFGGTYATVPESLIDLLRSGAEEPQVHRPLFTQGQKLRIIAGPFASLEAVFEMQEGADRAMVLLDLLGRQSRVSVDINQLVAGD
ncbi:MAG: transcription/translation regulatory transformer protein RfaH [Steroidobacteraceae bacterium]